MNLAQMVMEGLVEVREHLGRTLLQTTGVILGVTSVVATLGLTAGQEAQRQELLRETGGALLMGVFNEAPAELELTALQRAHMGLAVADAAAIRGSIPGFAQVVPVISRSHDVSAAGRGGRLNLEITASEPALARLRRLDAGRGRLLTDTDLRSAAAVAVLGATRARQLFGTTDPIGQTMVIDAVSYTVVGLFAEKVYHIAEGDRSNVHEWMKKLILVPVTCYLRRHVGTGDQVDELYLRLTSAEVHGRARQALERLLQARHGDLRDFGIWDRQEQLEQERHEGAIYDLTFLACGIISLLVGGIVITNILLASFTQRMREVGIRKAIGATGWQVFLQLLVESLVITIFGGSIGLGLGLLITVVASQALNVRVVITPAMIVTAVGASTAVGLIFGLHPALRAARLDPVAALRYE